MNKKLAIPIAIFLAISLLGVTQAYWTDELKIHASIKTGTFKGFWSVLVNTIQITGDWKELVCLDAWAHATDDYQAYAVICNAYPGVCASFEAGIHWDGTVPAHMDGVPIYEVHKGAIDGPIVDDGSVTITITPVTAGPFQLHKGFEYYWRFEICLNEDDYGDPPYSPDQLETYYIIWLLDLKQWNAP